MSTRQRCTPLHPSSKLFSFVHASTSIVSLKSRPKVRLGFGREMCRERPGLGGAAPPAFVHGQQGRHARLGGGCKEGWAHQCSFPVSFRVRKGTTGRRFSQFFLSSCFLSFLTLDVMYAFRSSRHSNAFFIVLKKILSHRISNQ